MCFHRLNGSRPLQQLVNVDPEFRRLGSIDAAMGVKVGSRVFVVIFEAFECTEVRDGSEADLDDLDFYVGVERGRLARFGREHQGQRRSGPPAYVEHPRPDRSRRPRTGTPPETNCAETSFFGLMRASSIFFDQAAKLETVFE